MEKNLTMPRLGLTMTEGVIGRWLKQEGEDFAEGDDLVEIESDKSIVTEQAKEAGRLVRIIHAEGDTVPVFEAIAVIWTPERA